MSYDEPMAEKILESRFQGRSPLDYEQYALRALEKGARSTDPTHVSAAFAEAQVWATLRLAEATGAIFDELDRQGRERNIRLGGHG